jgi:transposase-like protein
MFDTLLGMQWNEEILAQEIVRLYRDEGLSTEAIARRLGWSASAIRSRLVAHGIPRRTPWARNAVECDPTDVVRLYVDEGLSLSAIAEMYGCSLTTIWRKAKTAGIECREGGSGQRYQRTDFSGDLAEKAYLIGFRIGDLNVELHGHTIAVKCTSTRTEQVDLFRQLFEGYGHVYTDEATLARRKRQSIGMSVALNMSFEFLLPKQDAVPDWVLKGSDQEFFAFLAGYIDAEGYIRTYLPPGYRTLQVRIEVRSYDGVLLSQLAEGLNVRGIAYPPAEIRVDAGYVNRSGIRSNGVQWGLGIYRKQSLTLLFEQIDAHLRHGRRRRDMMRAWNTILRATSSRRVR